ncbi:probable cytochrome P450 313a4 isoform X1 [Drosophila nasuta]|uniref:probable cytochrome P450 313a4 isoform X1 n=2 Tax=Drosophila nasuta TaxID=42062 RepID=UPI00295EC72D|nr:probable cytochrome P450 313a4 isoform X1 [Drosophila nasuta]
MFTWQLWCTLLCVLWVYFLWTRRRFYNLIFTIPGPIGYPLIGIAHKLRRREDVLKTFKNFLNKYGSFLIIWLGPMPFFVTTDPQLIQDILNSQNCLDKANVYRVVNDVAGVGLITAKEPHWSVLRKMLNPAFGLNALTSLVPTFNAEANSLLKMVEPLVDSGEQDLLPLLQNFSLNVASQTTMGCGVNENGNIESHQLLNISNLQESMTEIFFSPWLISRTLRQLFGREDQYFKAKTEIRGFINKLIEPTLSKVSEQLKDKNNFLNLATDLKNRGIFTTQNVEDHSVQIVFAAFETTANTVAYTLMLLAMFPEYQEKAFEELCSLFPKSGDFDVSYSDIKNLVYLDLILNESMRLLTPVPIVARQTMRDVRLSNGIFIPKGVQIAIDIFHLHRDKKIWGENADTFDPEHFLPHNLQEKHPYSFIPFTKGIRNCIGWRHALISIKIILTKLLRTYKFSTSFKFEDLDFVEDLTLKFKTVPLLDIQRRDC